MVVALHVSTKKTAREFLVFRIDEIFIKFGGLIPESTQDTTAVAFPKKAVAV